MDPPAIDQAGAGGADPEHEAVLADSVGLALLVVLEALTPAERLAFVLHDMFAVPFEEIAPIVERSPAAARQLASRARRRVRQADAVPEAQAARRREVVGAFLAASRGGDFEALLALLDPDIVLRADAADARIDASGEMRGAPAVAGVFAGRAAGARLALIDGVPGLMWAQAGQIRAVFDFTVVSGKIAAIELISDPGHLAELEVVPVRRAEWLPGPGGRQRRHGVGPHDAGVEARAGFGDPALRPEVNEDNAEPLLVTPRPLEVVQ